MSLTLESERQLENVGLVKHFESGATSWEAVARETYVFVKGKFHGATVRRDDIAKFLVPVLEADVDFRDHLDAKKLKSKHWISDFADLIIDRTWHTISV